MSAAELAQIGRLAFRVEGDFWVAYHAEIGTMEGAHELARVAMVLVQTTERKNQFLAFMRDSYADLVESALGVRPQFPDAPSPAPEIERAGRG